MSEKRNMCLYVVQDDVCSERLDLQFRFWYTGISSEVLGQGRV